VALTRLRRVEQVTHSKAEGRDHVFTGAPGVAAEQGAVVRHLDTQRRVLVFMGGTLPITACGSIRANLLESRFKTPKRRAVRTNVD
jgi:hypothetical protein